MKAKADCITCMCNQGLNTARKFSDDPALHVQVLKETAELIRNASLDNNPAMLTQPTFKIVSKLTGIPDLFKAIRAETNESAMKIRPMLRDLIKEANDPLDAALHVAAAGNVIDHGPGHDFNIEKDILEMMTQDFAISAIKDLRADLGPGKKLLYLGDNSGEIVLDTLLIELLLETGTEVTFTVKSGPIINDVLMKDAEDVGMTDLVTVIETGGDDVGVNWDNVSDEFVQAFENADIIISKGHGNFETCDDRPENIYFLLKTKCDVVAEALGVTMGDIVFAKTH